MALDEAGSKLSSGTMGYEVGIGFWHRAADGTYREFFYAGPVQPLRFIPIKAHRTNKDAIYSSPHPTCSSAGGETLCRRVPVLGTAAVSVASSGDGNACLLDRGG